MSDWVQAQVVRTAPAAAGLVALDLAVPQALVQAHVHPGQYVKLRLPEVGEGFFAIASPPGPGPFEFLIKRGARVADALAALSPGDPVQVSAVQGKGFPLERAAGKDVLLFGTGSGISPLRSLIGVLAKDRAAYRKVTLYFGARTPDAFAYQGELEAWSRAGIEVVRTVSQPGDSGWDGLVGYVQSHVPEVPLGDAVAFLCGQKAMVQGVTEVLVARGLPPANVFQNF